MNGQVFCHEDNCVVCTDVQTDVYLNRCVICDFSYCLLQLPTHTCIGKEEERTLESKPWDSQWDEKPGSLFDLIDRTGTDTGYIPAVPDQPIHLAPASKARSSSPPTGAFRQMPLKRQPSRPPHDKFPVFAPPPCPPPVRPCPKLEDLGTSNRVRSSTPGTTPVATQDKRGRAMDPGFPARSSVSLNSDDVTPHRDKWGTGMPPGKENHPVDLEQESG